MVFLAMAAVVLLTFRDYGLAWDEPFQEHYGSLIAQHILSVGASQEVHNFRNLHLYGGLFDGLAAFVAMVSPLEPFHTRHLLIALTGLLGAAGVWTMARAMGGPAAGFWALVVVLAIPSYTGHMFINPKDIPFAAGTIWTLYFAMRAVSELPQGNDGAALGLGVALGATMGVRIGGVVLISYLAILLVLHFIWLRGRANSSLGLAAAIRILMCQVAIVVLVSCVFTFALWPSAWPMMFDKAVIALLVTARFKFDVALLFQGETLSSLALPATYLPGYFAVKLPEIVLALFIVSMPFALWRLMRALRCPDRTQVFGVSALALGIFAPLVLAITLKSIHYDAIRHFLFVLPPISVLIGIELSAAVAWLAGKKPLLSLAAMFCVLAGLLVPVVTMVGLHPYSYTYYSALAGGVSGAQGRYELDYWATSYREASRWLRTARQVPVTGPVGVYVCGPTDSAARFLPHRFRIVRRLDEAQFFIGFSRWNCDAIVRAPVLHSVERLGAVFAVVKDLRGGFALKGKLPDNIRINEDYPRYDHH
jgi:hypothetical protein